MVLIAFARLRAHHTRGQGRDNGGWNQENCFEVHCMSLTAAFSHGVCRRIFAARIQRFIRKSAEISGFWDCRLVAELWAAGGQL